MSYYLPSQGLHAKPCTFVDLDVRPVLSAQTETILEMRRDLINGPCNSKASRSCLNPAGFPQFTSCQPSSPQAYDGLITNKNRPLQYPFIHAELHPGQLPVSSVIANSQSTRGFSSGVDYRRAATRNCSHW